MSDLFNEFEALVTEHLENEDYGRLYADMQELFAVTTEVLSLRDRLAIAALQGILANHIGSAERMVEDSYVIADTMLKHRRGVV